MANQHLPRSVRSVRCLRYMVHAGRGDAATLVSNTRLTYGANGSLSYVQPGSVLDPSPTFSGGAAVTAPPPLPLPPWAAPRLVPVPVPHAVHCPTIAANNKCI